MRKSLHHHQAAPGSEIGNDDAASDAEQTSSAHKRRKTGMTKCDDEYTVSKRREALTDKANTGKFTGLRAETPARRNSAKTASTNKEKGVFRSSWDKWDKDKGSVHFNHSTCPKWDYKAVSIHVVRTRSTGPDLHVERIYT